MDERRATRQSMVLFDFDGVLFKGDAFTSLLRHHCAREWWRVVVAAPLLLVVSPLLLLRSTRPRVMRSLLHLALLGVSPSRYRSLAHAHAAALVRDSRHFVRAGLEALKAHRHAGARVIVVSGCEATLARAILDGLGLGDIELVASHLAPGRLGLRVRVHTVGLQKVQQLRLLGLRPPFDVAYGDSFADLHLLAAARSAILVNPDRQLLMRLSARLKQRLSIVEWS